MDKFVDFSNAKIVIRHLGGSNRKFRIMYDDKYYMLKFTEAHIKKSDFSTSRENNVISEYISSHIAKSVGLDSQNTILGEYQSDANSVCEVCVACEDFRSLEEENIEFYELGKMIYTPSEFKKIARLDQIYEIFNDNKVFPETLKEKGIERYWDTFVIDALVGNFDRHSGNWGIVSNIKTNEIRLAPIYDFESTLFPDILDEDISEINKNTNELVKLGFFYPSATLYLTSKKKRKPGYYDLLSSNYNEDCTKAFLRIFPRINMKKIYKIIDNVPIISELRKGFYKQMLTLRYELILHKAYDLCVSKSYDQEALYRLQNNVSVSEKMMSKFINENIVLINHIMM